MYVAVPISGWCIIPVSSSLVGKAGLGGLSQSILPWL